MEKEPRNTVQTGDQPEKRDYIYVRYENNDDDEMSIYDIIDLCRKGLLIAKKHLVLLLVFLVLGAALGFAKAKLLTEDSYTSSSLLFLDIDYGSDSNAGIVSNSGQLSMLASSFTQIINSDSLAAPIAKQYEYDLTDGKDSEKFYEHVTVEVPSGTQTIKLTVTSDDPESAQGICDALTTAGMDAMNDATDYATIRIVSPASAASKAASEGAVSSTGLGALIFFAIAVLIVAVKELGIAYKAYKANEVTPPPQQ